MPVKISRNPLAFRARSKDIEVVVNAEQPELGAVRVTVCELPKGLLQELRDDEAFFRQEIETLSEDIEACDRRKQESVARQRELSSDAATISAVQLRHDEESAGYRAKRKEARRSLSGVQLSAIRWGVCDHLATDFADEETGEPYTFEEDAADYDGVRYRVASPVTLGAYGSVGLPFVQALFEAVLLWQRGETRRPDEIWAAVAARKASLAKLVEEKLSAMRGETPNPLAPTETTPTQTTTDSEIPTN